MLYFNRKVREDIIRTLNRIANIGGFAQLGAAATQAIEYGHFGGFLVALGFVIGVKVPVWLIMASEPDKKEDGKS